jgi:hypothetical protein
MCLWIYVMRRPMKGFRSPVRPFPLEHAARALARVQQGTNGQAVVRQPSPARGYRTGGR